MRIERLNAGTMRRYVFDFATLVIYRGSDGQRRTCAIPRCMPNVAVPIDAETALIRLRHERQKVQ